MGDAPAVEMVVVKVSPYLSANRPLLWLCEKETANPRLLPIAIGQFEAAAIQMHLDNEQPPRPISYDLLATMVEEGGVEVLQVVIHSVRRHTFYAKVLIEKDRSIKEIDSRPSDAVALALRLDAPIFVSEELLVQVGLESTDGEPDVERTMARFYETEPQIVEAADISSPESSPSTLETGPDSAEQQSTAAEQAVDHVEETVALAETTPGMAQSAGETELELLQAKLEQAVLCEEYEAAAKLRDRIESLLSKKA